MGGWAVEAGDLGDAGSNFVGIGNVHCVVGQRNCPEEAALTRWPVAMVWEGLAVEPEVFSWQLGCREMLAMMGGGQWWGEKHAVARETQQSAKFRWGIGGQGGGSNLRRWSLELVGFGASNGGLSLVAGGNLMENKIYMLLLVVSVGRCRWCLSHVRD